MRSCSDALGPAERLGRSGLRSCRTDQHLGREQCVRKHHSYPPPLSVEVQIGVPWRLMQDNDRGLALNDA